MKMMKFDRIKKLDRVYLFMIGAVAVVAGVILYIIVMQHGPAICSNAATCG